MEVSKLVIKDEPIDVPEYGDVGVCGPHVEGVELQLKMKQEQIEPNETEEMTRDDFVASIKVEYDEFGGPYDMHASDDVQVVDEQANIITVKAADAKSEDERIFIERIKAQNQPNIRKRTRKTYEVPCPKCKQRFYSMRSYTQHVEYNMCELVEGTHCCLLCPLAFGTQEQLNRHLKLHQDNHFFCGNHCGRHFEALEQCEQHEYREHLRRNIKCYICNHKFSTTVALSKHMSTHDNLLRFACSFCRLWFTTWEELLEHWDTGAKNCGRLMASARNSLKRKANSAGVENISAKRCKTDAQADQSSCSATVNLPNHFDGDFERNIQIKEEPQDDFLTVAIKTALPENMEIKIEPVAEEAGMLEHIIKPIASSAASSVSIGSFAAYKLKLKTVPNLKMFKLKEMPEQLKTTTDTTTIAVTTPTTTATNSSILLTPFKQMQTDNGHFPSLKVIKLSPNVKIMRLPSKASTALPATVNSSSLTSDINSLNTKSPDSANFQIMQLPAASNIKTVRLKAPDMQKLLDSGSLKSHKHSAAVAPSTTVIIKTTPHVIATTKRAPVVTVSLHSLNKNTTIDEQDLKKLLAEATRKADKNMSKLWLTKDTLEVIDNLPQKREVIEHIMQSLKAAEAPTATVKSNETTADTVEQGIDSAAVKTQLSFNDNSKESCKTEEYSSSSPLSNIKVEMDTEPPMPLAAAKTSTTSSINSDAQPLKCSARGKSHQGGSTAARKYICDKCERVCSSKTMLNDHVRANCSRDPQYSCILCPKKFFSASTLSCHMTIHTGALPHKCNFCDKLFRTRGQVTVHHRTHTGERPFACQVCSQSFTHRETLISHLSRHIGMKRYKCYACDKHFSCISGLKMHRDNRPNTCAKVKLNSRAVGPRVRVVRGAVFFEPQPEINPYLRTEDPQDVLAEIQNQQQNH